MNGKQWIWPLALVVAGLLATGAAPATGDDDGTVVIGALSHWFAPVDFPHADHLDMVDDCTDCHHHADGETEACDTCHPAAFSPDDPEIPLLNAAYHERCAGCHVEQGGPTGCTECHERRALPAGPPLRGFAAP